MTIVNDSSDTVISNAKFEDDDFDADLEDNIEITNYVLKDSNISISYDQIDNEFELDAQLEQVTE
jgi:hypothetical protein